MFSAEEVNELNEYLKICFLIAASPTDGFFSQVGMFRLSLNSLGGVYKDADIFLSLGGEKIISIPDRWTEHLSEGVVINWADPLEYLRIGNRAQGENKWKHDYSAYDLIIFSDADTILVNPIDELLSMVKEKNLVSGVIAHYPFPHNKGESIDDFWQILSNKFAGKDIELTYTHTLPGNRKEINQSKCPFYLNFGFVVMTPRVFMSIRETYLRIRMEISSLLQHPIFSGQIALTLAIHKHNISTHSIDMRYNFPNDPIADKLYPEQLKNVSIIHYLRTEKFDRQKIFATEEAFNDFLLLDLEGSNQVFQSHIRAITHGRYPFKNRKKEDLAEIKPFQNYFKKYKSQNKKLIVVLGMHRSGTSVITRGLQTMGVDLGHALLPVQDDNPKGFWEDVDINALNMEMLDFLNKDWYHLSPIEGDDVDRLFNRGYHLRASELLRRKMSNSQIFGFKDPRLAQLSLFWQEVFSLNQLDVSYVISIRHPLSVGESLAKRDNFEFERSYLLWAGYVIASFVNTMDKKCVVVDYDLLMHSPEEELIRVADKLDLQINADGLEKFKNDFLDNKLQHSTYQLRDLDDTVPVFVSDLYKQILNVATDKLTIDDENFRNSIRKWHDELSRQKTALVLSDKLQIKLNTQNKKLATIYSSKAWRAVLLLRQVREQLFPIGSNRDKLLQWGYSSLKVWHHEGLKALLAKIKRKVMRRFEYKHWIRKNEPGSKALVKQRSVAKNFNYKPLVSVVMPVWNTPAHILESTITSVIEQTYGNWELCIADGNSGVATRDILLSLEKKDNRIRVKFLEENKGIAVNTNEALTLAQGEFVAFLDHDDLLAPFALFEVVKSLQFDRSVDLIYSDEDLISEDGKKRYGHHFKPSFSPDLLRSINYITHLLVVRKTFGDRIGWFRNGYEGAQDYDFILRLVEKTDQIMHIPKILYHWRQWASSTTNKPDTPSDAKKLANELGKRALAEHLERSGLDGVVENGPDFTTYQVRYIHAETPLVSIIILNRNHADDLEKCVHSIQSKSTYQNYEIVIVENGSFEDEISQLYDRYQKNSSIRILKYEEQPFNYSRANNFGASQALGSILLFLNNDTEVITPDWLERMLEHVQRENVAVVGAKLIFPTNQIQHAGAIVGIRGYAGHAHKHFSHDATGYINRLRLIQNYSAVTGACAMVRKDVFNEIGGFDEAYPLAGSDIDFCLQALAKDYSVVWTPYAELYHYESKTRGDEKSWAQKKRFSEEKKYFQQKWESFLKEGDPFYNPNLTLKHEDFRVAYK